MVRMLLWRGIASGVPAGHSRHRSPNLKPFILSAALFLAAFQAPAATVSYNDTHRATTDWTAELSVPQFDPALGLLQQVTMELAGESSTLFRFENRSRAPRTATQDATATLAFNGPVSTNMVISLAVTADVSAADGVADWGGPAGYSQGMSDSAVHSWQWLAGPDDLSAFIGTGPLVFDVTALGVSNSISGSRWASISTQAGATVRIGYAYRPTQAVPEPGSLALACLALGLFAVMRRSA